MARKSRKKTGSAVCVSTSPAVKPFSTAIYARLSVENSGKNDDGDSIENQVSICREYIEERPYLSLTDVFSDNGAKGTSFERPEFNRMMDMIKAGKINAVVCKDLSRFGRDYIETGNYLEKIFPFLGVRFIAITDHFDSFETDGSEESLMIPLKNMINELYAKDISRKIRTSFDERMAKGEFLPGFIPYGYVKSKTVEYGIDVDEEVAENIKRIFKWRLEGASIPEINRRLNALGATTPAVRKLQLGIWHSEKYNNPEWRGCTVKNILTNPLYTGWAKFLERVNEESSATKLLDKIDKSAKRNNLSFYRQILFDEFESKNCFYCGKPLSPNKVHVDHFIPWSFIKDDNLWNLVLACPSCNAKKNDKLPVRSYLDSIIERNRHIIVELHRPEMRNYQASIISRVYDWAKLNGYDKEWKPSNQRKVFVDTD